MKYAEGGQIKPKRSRITLIMDGKSYSYPVALVNGRVETTEETFKDGVVREYLDKEFDLWIDQAPKDYEEMYYGEESIMSKRGAIDGAMEIVMSTIEEEAPKKTTFNFDEGDVEFYEAYQYAKGGSIEKGEEVKEGDYFINTTNGEKFYIDKIDKKDKNYPFYVLKSKPTDLPEVISIAEWNRFAKNGLFERVDGKFAKGGKVGNDLYIEQLASISDASPALVKLWSIEENNLSKNDLSNILQGLRTNEINRFAFLNALLGDEERTSEIISYAKSQKSSKMAKGGEVGKTLDKTEKYWFERIKNSNSKSVSTHNLSTNDVLILNRLSSMGLVDKAVIKGTQEATFTFKEKHAKGGKIGFEGLANKVAKRYIRKKVAKQYQDEYGKTYDAKESKEVGNKVAGKVYQQQVAKKKIVRKLQRKTN
jgi:hypothetical protein